MTFLSTKLAIIISTILMVNLLDSTLAWTDDRADFLLNPIVKDELAEARVQAEDDYLNQFEKRSGKQGLSWFKENPKKFIYDPYQSKNGYSIGMGKRAKFGKTYGIPKDEYAFGMGKRSYTIGLGKRQTPFFFDDEN